MLSAVANNQSSSNFDRLYNFMDQSYDVVYSTWYRVVKNVTEGLNHRVSPAVGSTVGMILSEAHVLVKAAYHTFVKYSKSADHYLGLNCVNTTPLVAKNPVILVHGAAGSWNYMGDLALALREKGHHVHHL
ncbi:MAG: hypothetical protein P0S95_04085 [Rhabdochlamydiaceae bacterium]|nr:hypothetical protein [Candidatus Amphrikana amoebophyrae]